MDGLLTTIDYEAAGRTVALIGAACGLGAPDGRCAAGPAALRAHGVARRLRARGLNAAWTAMLAPRPAETTGAAIAAFCARLAGRTEEALDAGARFGVIGGDHAVAVGTWSGASNALAGRGPLGLVWVDAHMDSHTPATTPSGRYHGMPLACLLGHGDAALTGIARRGPALAPGHVCLVGVRSHEQGERALLERLGVRVFSAADVARRGLAAVLREAAAIALDGTAGAGLSVDLDAVDPRDAPGVGSPVAGGLSGAALVGAVAAMCRDPRFVGCEIVEYNPAKDVDGRTAALATGLLEAFFAADGR